MFMSIFNNKNWLLLIVLLGVAACGTKTPSVPAPVAPTAVAEQPEETPATETVAEPEPEPEPVDFNQQFYEEAVTALKGGDTATALELLLQVSREAPDKPFVFTNLGLTYFKLQKLDLAEEAFQQAVERNSRDAVAHNHLGILQRQKGQFKDALKHYQRAIAIDSGYARAHLNLGILFDIYLQDLKKALVQYQRYQNLVSEEDSQVAGWIVDIERRLKSAGGKSQG